MPAPPVGDTRLLSLLYIVFVFLSGIGVLQLVATYSRMKALSLFTNSWIGYIFGTIALVAGPLIFFLTGDRNVIEPRLEGVQLFGFAVIGLLLAILVTTTIAYFIKRNKVEDGINDDCPDGMEALNHALYFPLLKRLWRRYREWSGKRKHPLSGGV